MLVLNMAGVSNNEVSVFSRNPCERKARASDCSYALLHKASCFVDSFDIFMSDTLIVFGNCGAPWQGQTTRRALVGGVTCKWPQLIVGFNPFTGSAVMEHFSDISFSVIFPFCQNG